MPGEVCGELSGKRMWKSVYGTARKTNVGKLMLEKMPGEACGKLMFDKVFGELR